MTTDTNVADVLASAEQTLAMLMPRGYSVTTAMKSHQGPIVSPIPGRKPEPPEPLHPCAIVTRPSGTTYEVDVLDPADLVAQTIHSVFECTCEEENERFWADKRDRRAWKRTHGDSRPSSLYRPAAAS